MNLEITYVKSKADIKIVVRLANEIWREHFTPIIGIDQVEYMLEKYQNLQAINSQIDSGWIYYMFKFNDEFVAYTALVAEPNNKKLMLSKVYVKKETRGKGIGAFILNFIESKYKNYGYKLLWLTVNRFNKDTIKWYIHHEFVATDKVKKDIGGGYFMDDYIMEKKI